MEGNNAKSGVSCFFVGMLAGLVMGGVATLLYAPRSGSETRAVIREKAQDTRDRTMHMVDQAKSKVSELRGKSEQKAEELASRVRESA